MKYSILMIIFLAFFFPVYAQLNVELLHQLVKHSKDEYGRQLDSKKKQFSVSVNEEVNLQGMEKLKTKYSSLDVRFQMLSMAVQASQVGIRAADIIHQITLQQKRILETAVQKPLLTAMAFRIEADVSQKLYRLTNYIYALSLSIGSLNQMKQGDRKILLEYILTELRLIEGNSRALATMMYYSAHKNSSEMLNPFAVFINRDKRIIEDIMAKIKGIHR